MARTDHASTYDAATARLTFTVFWRFALLSIGYAGLTYLVRTFLVIGLVARKVTAAQLPIVMIGADVVFAIIYYLLAYVLLRWLLGEHVGDDFVLRQQTSQPVRGNPIHD